jgi:hypothetical protein
VDGALPVGEGAGPGHATVGRQGSSGRYRHCWEREKGCVAVTGEGAVVGRRPQGEAHCRRERHPHRAIGEVDAVKVPVGHAVEVPVRHAVVGCRGAGP